MSLFQEYINKCVEIVRSGGLILYPTDTVWAIGCDATNQISVEKIHQLKQISKPEPMVSLVANQFMLERYVDFIPDVVYDILDVTEKPTTIVFDSAKDIAKNALAADGSAAFRVASDEFCQYMIGKLGKPIIATSANFSNTPHQNSFDQIQTQILKDVDYVVNLPEEIKFRRPSSILKISNDNMVKIIRQ